MSKITYVHSDGATDVIDGESGSIMQLALANDVTGIIAECGGNAMCATCHVYVDEANLDAMPAMSAEEDAMLDCTVSPREGNSRLSCQLPVNADPNGITVRVPESQV